ncbi:hypothetical protein GC194_02815 [bacterium]|nr:hypothetical protein [bacterium]
MFRIITSLLVVLFCSSFAQDEFDSKTAALDYLNHSNIWVAGLPEYSLNNETGVLSIKVTSGTASLVSEAPLANMSAELKEGKTITVEMNCNDGAFCVQAKAANKNLETDGVTLVMYSTFDDGTYRPQYLEKGGKIVAAINYLTRFYQP